MKPGYHPKAWDTPEKNGGSLKKQGFYHKPAWRRARLLALQRDHYLCQACLKKRRITKATEVHHIRPLEDYPELALDLTNLQSLCWSCHEETKPHGKRETKAPKGVKVIKISNGENE